jgi:hypothetical protein
LGFEVFGGLELTIKVKSRRALGYVAVSVRYVFHHAVAVNDRAIVTKLMIASYTMSEDIRWPWSLLTIALSDVSKFWKSIQRKKATPEQHLHRND